MSAAEKYCPFSGKRRLTRGMAEHLLATHTGGKRLTNAYHCPHCESWHVTSEK